MRPLINCCYVGLPLDKANVRPRSLTLCYGSHASSSQIPHVSKTPVDQFLELPGSDSRGLLLISTTLQHHGPQHELVVLLASPLARISVLGIPISIWNLSRSHLGSNGTVFRVSPHAKIYGRRVFLVRMPDPESTTRPESTLGIRRSCSNRVPSTGRRQPYWELTQRHIFSVGLSDPAIPLPSTHATELGQIRLVPRQDFHPTVPSQQTQQVLRQSHLYGIFQNRPQEATTLNLVSCPFVFAPVNGSSVVQLASETDAAQPQPGREAVPQPAERAVRGLADGSAERVDGRERGEEG